MRYISQVTPLVSRSYTESFRRHCQKMDTFWWILLCVAAVAAVVFAVLVHAGLLYSPIIRVSHPASMPRRSAYVLRTGPYKKAGKEFDRLIKLVPKDTTLFGVYYDDPDKVHI